MISSRLMPAPLRTEIVRDFWDGAVTLITCGQPINWRPDLEKPDTCPALAELDKLARRHLIEEVLYPRPAFTGRVESSALFRPSIDRKDYVILRPSSVGGIGDAVDLAPGQAYLLPSGDCWAFQARNRATGDVIAAHTGRENLIDKRLIAEGIPSRPHESIVDAAMASFTWYAKAAQQKFNPSDIDVHITCGIAAKSFPHDDPEHAEYNAKMYTHVSEMFGESVFAGDPRECRLDMPELIRRQFARHGVNPECVTHDDIDTYSDTDIFGRHLWWSNRRNEKNRNLVLVVRRW